MKNIATSILMLALTALAAGAQLSSEMGTAWCRTLDAAPPDMGIDLALNAQGDALFYLSSVGSTIGAGESGFPKDFTDPTMTIRYDGEVIATEAAPYEGASFNDNLNLLKTDLDGRFLWTVYSTSGEIMSNNGGIAPTPDGGAMVAAVVRHTDNMRTTPLRLVDATGATTTIDWTLAGDDESRYYKGLLLKVSAEGAIEWTRLIDVSNAPQPGQSGATTMAFYISAVTPTADGGMTIAARYVNPITLEQADGTSLTLTPHNTEGWDGDSQKSRGDVLVAQFDAQGHLTRHLVTGGVATLETSPTVQTAGDDLILNFMATGTGAEDCAITLDGHSIALPTASPVMITARLSGDLEVQWVNAFATEGVGGRNAVIQNNHVNVIGDNLWLTGMGNFKLYSETGEQSFATATGNVREGYVIKCDAATGRYLAGVASKAAVPAINGIVGFMGGFESEGDGNFYVYGYNMSTDGILLTAFDAATLEAVDHCSLLTGGGQPTAQEMVAQGDRLYTLSRGRTIYNEWMDTRIRPINSEIAVETTEWAVVCSAFELPFTARTGNEKAVVNGDVNGDGSVNATDLSIVVNIIAGLDDKDNYAGRADVNGDNDINATDIATIVNLIAGLQ